MACPPDPSEASKRTQRGASENRQSLRACGSSLPRPVFQRATSGQPGWLEKIDGGLSPEFLSDDRSSVTWPRRRPSRERSGRDSGRVAAFFSWPRRKTFSPPKRLLSDPRASPSRFSSCPAALATVSLIDATSSPSPRVKMETMGAFKKLLDKFTRVSATLYIVIK